jgi:hypothetical protein
MDKTKNMDHGTWPNTQKLRLSDLPHPLCKGWTRRILQGSRVAKPEENSNEKEF